MRRTPLVRRTPLRARRPMPVWIRPDEDKVTPEVRAFVLKRDGGCVAPRLGAADPCSGDVTLDHVRAQPMMGKRAPSSAMHLVSVCRKHHLDGWATAHRPELRAYLSRSN